MNLPIVLVRWGDSSDPTTFINFPLANDQFEFYTLNNFTNKRSNDDNYSKYITDAKKEAAFYLELPYVPYEQFQATYPEFFI